MIFADYDIDDNCCNTDSCGYICVKCGRCGRQFDENGFLIENEASEEDVKEWLKMVEKIRDNPYCVVLKKVEEDEGNV